MIVLGRDQFHQIRFTFASNCATLGRYSLFVRARGSNWQLANGNWQNRRQKREKRQLDQLVTGWSNGGWVFVFNKILPTPGWGDLTTKDTKEHEVRKREGKERSMAEEKEVRKFWPGENSRGFTEEEEAEWRKSSEWRNMVRVEAMRDARRARLQKEEEARKWSATEAGKLLRQLGESFKLYRDYLERNPELQEKALECDEMNQKIFHQMQIGR